jgi:hypothetical protein
MSKKDIERHYFDRFRQFCQSFPDGLVTSTEEPDFLIVGKHQTIGVELTELHREASPGQVSLQAIESMRHRLAARAQQLYVQSGGTPVRCTIIMQEAHIDKSQVELIAKDIVKIARRNMPLPNASLSESYDWTNRSYFPDIIDTVSVHRLDAITETHFYCPGATWVPKLLSDDIIRTLSAKSRKYAAYRASCDQAWLLINTDIGAMSTWFDFEPDALAGPFVTTFDRVFVMRHFVQALHDLSLAKA